MGQDPPYGSAEPVLHAVALTNAHEGIEYGVEATFEPVSVTTARWVHCSNEKKLEEFREKNALNLALDAAGHLVYLAPTRVNLSLMEERWPDIKFRATREHH